MRLDFPHCDTRLALDAGVSNAPVAPTRTVGALKGSTSNVIE